MKGAFSTFTVSSNSFFNLFKLVIVVTHNSKLKNYIYLRVFCNYLIPEGFYRQPSLPCVRIACFFFFRPSPVWHAKMSRSYSSRGGYMTLLCKNNFSQLLELGSSRPCCSNWRDAHRLSLHAALRWKLSRDKMRKLKKELVSGDFGRHNMCVPVMLPFTVLGVCLTCAVSLEAAEKWERACVLFLKLQLMEELVLLTGQLKTKGQRHWPLLTAHQ